MAATLLLSRKAEACFWLSRYRERAEFTARVLDVHLHTQLDTTRLNGNAYSEWLPILRINSCEAAFLDGTRPLDTANALHCLVLDQANPNSIAACIRIARENSRQAREQISSEMWEQVNDIYHEINNISTDRLLANSHDVLDKVKAGALLLQGLADQTMMHGEAWRFIQVGRYLERANTTARLLTARADPEGQQGQYREALHWIAVLKSASSLEAYHKTYTAPVSANAAIEFLLLSEELPRSILFCMENALTALHHISGTTEQRYNGEADRLLGQMASQLHYLRLEDVDLLAFLHELQRCISDVTEAITQTYFAYEVA